MQIGSYSADEMLTIVHNGTPYTYAGVPEDVYKNVKLLIDKNAPGKIIKLLTPYKIDKSLITRRNLTTMKPPIARGKDYEWSPEVADFYGVPRTFDAWVLTYPKELIALAKEKKRIIGVSSIVPATINNKAELEKDWDNLLVSLGLKNKESTMKDEQIEKAIDIVIDEEREDGVLRSSSVKPAGEGGVPMRVVLRDLADGTPQPFVTHIQNAKTGAFEWGHYFSDEERAKANYLKRCEEYEVNPEG